MEFSPIMAFGFVALTFAVGDYIALKTRGVVSTFITAILVFILFGGVLKILPADLMERSGLTALIPTFGMVLILTNLGSTLDLNELKKEWRTILVSLAGVVGVILLCATVGRLLFGKEHALSAIAPISGGIVATMITGEAAKAAGRADLASFASAVMALQILIGLPLASFFLRKATAAYIEKGGHLQSQAEGSRRIDIHFLPATPQSLDTPTAHFARLAVVGALAQSFSGLTRLNATICYLLLGALAAAVGMLDKNSLKKAGGDGVMLLATYAYCTASFVTMTFSQFASILLPVFGLLLLGAVGVALFSVLMGLLFHWSPSLSIAVGLCCMLGYPVTYAVAMEVVTGASFGRNFTPEQVQNLTDYVLPKMLIAGVASVSVASVALAGVVAPLIF
ncbi:MAG: hypothetical protein VB096_01975 [Pseudoflavonifractor sp.]|nr:hypothetical protein [Pseudoflavonifractor sp.]